MRVQIVSFHCTLKNTLGQLISSSFNQDVLSTPSSGQVSELPGLAEAMLGIVEGERRKITLTADRAYGFYHPELRIRVARSKLSKGKSIGMGEVVFGRFTEESEPRNYRVVETLPHSVVLDGNHPLAGQDLVFEVEVTALREENTANDSFSSEQEKFH